MKSFRILVPTVGLTIAVLSSGCAHPTKASLADAPKAVDRGEARLLDAQGALDRAEAILGAAAPESLAQVPFSPLASRSIKFTRAEGTGEPERLEMLSDPADPVNGADDDGDGVIDGAQLVWTNSTGTSEVLCSGILPLGADEVRNGMDDNGNRLIDEEGVAFYMPKRGQIALEITVLGPGAAPVTLWRALKAAGD